MTKNNVLNIFLSRNFLLAAAVAALTAGCASPKTKVTSLSESEIDQLETRAAVGREHFNARKYPEASGVFEGMSGELTVSKPLYLNELASCYLARGEYEKAKKTLWEAHDLMEVLDPASEAKAMSLFGAEAQKFYKGDPYERSMNNLLLGLLFLKDNDVDNALACFNSGILCDSEVPNDEFKSDFFLLYALAAKCYKLRHQEDMYQKYVECARNALASTSPDVRQLLLTQQLLAKSRENNKLLQEQIVMDFIIDRLKLKIEKEKANVNLSQVNQLLNGDYDTLVVLMRGQSIRKGRSGQYGERLELYEPFKDERLRFEVKVGGSVPLDPAQNICDVNYQALTRGGRLMDEVLQKKASFKQNANTVSEVLIVGGIVVAGAGAATGDARTIIVCSCVGGSMIVTGAVIKGVAYYTVARCDIRCWQTLPGEIQVVPLKLGPGKHIVEVDTYRTYFKEGSGKITGLTITQPTEVNVIINYP